MEKNRIRIKRVLLALGIIELIAGLSHAFMPYFIFKSSGYSYLSLEEINIITCCVFSVGILLVAFGTLTVVCALKYDVLDKMMVYYFVFTKSILWALRTCLEVIFPTEIAMFLITRPSVVLIPVFIVIDCLFIFSVFLIRRDIKEGFFQQTT